MPAPETRSRPRLTFFCELEPRPLADLFAGAAVIDTLGGVGASVSLGLIDLSPERADVVRRLNAAGVPVTAWLLLPVEQGYYQHVENCAHSEARYGALRDYTARESLRWSAIGLDIEQDRRELERYAREPWRVVPVTVRRAFAAARLERGLNAYRALIARIRSDGYAVETYQFPLIADERAVGSKLLQRAFGMMDLEADREVLMLYSSILPPRGPGWLCSYGPEARAIAVGSTGGGVDPMPKSSWEELRRDLLLASRWTGDLYVFSLEGCVAQGMLPRIAELDWAEADAVAFSRRDARRIDVMRRALRIGLRASKMIDGAATAIGRSMRSRGGRG